MSEYTLLDTKIGFPASDDRFWEIQYKLWSRLRAASNAFEQWYHHKGDAEEALKTCLRMSTQLMEQYWVTPFKALVSAYQLGDIDPVELHKLCVDLSAMQKTINAALSVMDKIDKEYNEKKVVELLETCCNTPAPPNPVVGILIDPAAKMTGLDAPDCVVDWEGRKLNREISADPLLTGYARKKNLYRHMGGFLRVALENGMQESTNRLIQIVNRRLPGYITNSFSYDRCRQELMRAGVGEETDRGAVVAAFRACPWSKELYEFIFDHFATYRAKLFDIADVFHVDLGPRVEEILASMFEERSGDSPQVLVPLRKEILKTMDSYGVTSSQTLDELEFHLLEYVIADLEEADRKRCQEMLREIKKLDVQEKNKTVYNKKVRDRLQHMVETKTGETMDEYLLRCNILDPGAVSAGIDYVKEACPAATRNQYLAAFRSFNLENIIKARKYQPMSGRDFVSAIARYVGFLIMAAGFAFLAVSGWLKLLIVIPLALGLYLQIQIFNWRGIWNTMTLDGQVVHGTLRVDSATFKQMLSIAGTMKEAEWSKSTVQPQAEARAQFQAQTIQKNKAAPAKKQDDNSILHKGLYEE